MNVKWTVKVSVFLSEVDRKTAVRVFLTAVEFF